jgi:hypothetical protein
VAESNKLAIVRREKRISDLLSEGRNKAEICQILAGEFKVSPRTVERQYYSIVNELARESQESKMELRGTLLARLDQVYHAALADNKLQIAVNAISAQAKIGGLHDPKPQDELEQAR